MTRQTLFGFVVVTWCVGSTLSFGRAQTAAIVGAQFDVVSIKPHKYDPVTGGGMRTGPDGTFTMTSQPIASIISAASPVPVSARDVLGLPEWAHTEHYDVIAKPAPGSNPTREQRAEMMRNMLIERMKVAGHIEEQEQHDVCARGRAGRRSSRS